jgi:hypothetical protein
LAILVFFSEIAANAIRANSLRVDATSLRLSGTPVA